MCRICWSKRRFIPFSVNALTNRHAAGCTNAKEESIMKSQRCLSLALAALLCLTAFCALADDSWTCGQCGKVMQDGRFCSNCGAARPDSAAAEPGGQTAGPVLPDPQTFFSSLNYNELPRYMKSCNGNYCSFNTTAVYADALWEYADTVLGSYSYQLSYSFDSSGSGGTYHQWDRYLSYTGAEKLGCVSTGFDNLYNNGQVIISLQQDTKKNIALLSIYYSDGISFADGGQRCSRDDMPDLGSYADLSGRTAGNGGNTNASGSSANSGQGNTVCAECGGKGYRICHTCGGDGVIDIYISTPGYGGVGTGSRTKEQKPCSNIFCHGGKVECFFCQGTGKQ